MGHGDDKPVFLVILISIDAYGRCGAFNYWGYPLTLG